MILNSWEGIQLTTASVILEQFNVGATRSRVEMHNPAHPGEVIREACLKPLDLTVTAAAETLGVTRKALSDLLNGHSAVSADKAIRLEKVGRSTADYWMRMQQQRDLSEARQRPASIKVRKRFPAPVTPVPP
jgi:addiction module HigA family antidote